MMDTSAVQDHAYCDYNNSDREFPFFVGKSSVFSKFVSKSFQGIGLGLFISKGIIEAHGGKISAENNSNGIGATFSFSLPS